MNTPILTTKLRKPALLSNLVARPRLIECLNQGLDKKLILVSAPAGFGKTTLLSEWAHQAETATGWLALDENDNDLGRFLTYLAASLHNLQPSLEAQIPAFFQFPKEYSVEPLLATLINQVAEAEGHLALILDDYHLITSQAIHDALSYLLEHLPENLHLVIASRADPPLPIPRLRARGQLIELRQGDLRFTTEEAAAFLNNVMGLALSAKDVAALEERTEGWIAALQMAAISLAGHSPQATTRSEFIQAFTGSHRFVLDYLVEEVLEQQPAALQTFLLRTSILERLSGPLCDAVLEKPEIVELAVDKLQAASLPTAGSQAILEYLEAANLFIVPLDDERRWYRYHRLFTDLLQQRLKRSDPDLIPILHRRASQWYEQQGLMAEAIDHALAGGDFERAGDLIEGNAEAILMRSEVTNFLNWMEQLPGEWVLSHPSLCFFHAWALAMSGYSLAIVEQRLQEIGGIQDAPGGDSQMAGRIAVLRAYLSLFQTDMDRAAELCYQALELLPENDLFLRSIASWILSLVRLSDVGLQDGQQALSEVVRKSQEIGNPLVAVAALSHQARLQMRQGRLPRAQETLERALQIAIDPQGRRLPIASEALIGLGELKREWNDLEAAADHLTESIALAKQWSELAAFDAYFPLARVRLAQGDVTEAREILEIAWQVAQKSEVTEIDDYLADLQQLYFFVMQGDVLEAGRWVSKRGIDRKPGPQSELELGQDYVRVHLWKYEQLLLVRLLLLKGQAGEALARLAELSDQVSELGRADLNIEIQILRALSFQLEGQTTQALNALSAALTLAEPGGYLRIFLDEGEPMARLLRLAGSRGLAPSYVAKLLASFGEPVPPALRAQPLSEPLSERELEVLRLLAAGMSNPEIAGELVIAVSTVNSHCKSIYGKLDVHRRWEAVQQAQELGLI